MSEQVPPSSERLRQMASDLEKAVGQARAEQIAARAVARATVHPTRRRLTVAVVAGSMALLVGLGFTSANTLPGDSLYAVSRAYEVIGKRVGVVNSVERRLNEVIVLAERGDTARATRAAEEALAELGYTPELAVALPHATTTTVAGVSAEGDHETPPATAPSDITVEAPDDEGAEDVVGNLRVAAQLLLSHMQSNGEGLEAATAELAKAVSNVTTEKPPAVAEPTTTTTVDLTSTTTNEPEEETTTTSTTVPDSTTTTVSEEDEEEADGPGPIFLPPSP